MTDPKLTHSGFGGYGTPTVPTDVEPEADADSGAEQEGADAE
ncbi:hypothetical protein [Microcystis phage Mae-JY24]